MKKYYRDIKCLIEFQLSNLMAFSVDFWVAFFVDTVFFVVQLVMFEAIYLQVDSINGWSKYHMMIFIGSFTILDALYMGSFFFGVIEIPEKIRNGSLDIYMIKPINTLFYLSFEKVQINSFALIIPGVLMVLRGIRGLRIKVKVIYVCEYILLIFVMLFLVYNIMVILRSTAFWFTKVDAIGRIEDELVNFSFKIPGTIYKGITKIIFYFVLPYGLMSTIPTQALIGDLKLTDWSIVIVVSVVFTFVRKTIWKKGIHRYDSASS